CRDHFARECQIHHYCLLSSSLRLQHIGFDQVCPHRRNADVRRQTAHPSSFPESLSKTGKRLSLVAPMNIKPPPVTMDPPMLRAPVLHRNSPLSRSMSAFKAAIQAKLTAHTRYSRLHHDGVYR